MDEVIKKITKIFGQGSGDKKIKWQEAVNNEASELAMEEQLLVHNRGN